MENKCNICPRNCLINRNKKLGFCKSNNLIKIAKVMKHYWEEPIISGKNGSGAIFFSNCNLQCIFCQNYKISSEGFGREYSIDDLINIFKDIENSGVDNINLVSPTQYTKQIIEALSIYKPNIPIIWNSNGYEKPETIKKLKNLVDIYLVDLKYYSNELSYELSNAKDYFNYASKAILQMRENQPIDIYNNDLLSKGLIIRHLVLPNCTNDSLLLLNWINTNLGNNTIISIMNQYIPYFKAINHPKIGRKTKQIEYKRVLNKAIELGFNNGFMQEPTSADCCYIPNFDGNINI